MTETLKVGDKVTMRVLYGQTRAEFERNNPICTVCNKRHSEDADCPNE